MLTCFSSPLRMTQWLAVPWAEICPVPAFRRAVEGLLLAVPCFWPLTCHFDFTHSILHYLTPTFQNTKDPMKRIYCCSSDSYLTIYIWFSYLFFLKRKLSKEYLFIFMFLKIDINIAWSLRGHTLAGLFLSFIPLHRMGEVKRLKKKSNDLEWSLKQLFVPFFHSLLLSCFSFFFASI